MSFESSNEARYQAVRALTAREAADPEALVRELARSRDRFLRGEAFRIAREAMYSASLSPNTARDLILNLAEDVPAALKELTEPWATLDSLPEERVRHYLATGPTDIAIEVAAQQGHKQLLHDVLSDVQQSPTVRQKALELLGDIAEREDISGILELTAQDPLLLAKSGFTALLRMHHRGHFPSADDVPILVELSLADHLISAGDVAVLLYSCRHDGLREIIATNDESSWPRRLELLVALNAQGAPGLNIGEIVMRLARRAQDPAPFLTALRSLQYEPAEETVLESLPRSPYAALKALEMLGGSLTAEYLHENLGLSGGQVAPHLGSHTDLALELLWHLTDPLLRHSILKRLNPKGLPRRVRDDLGGPDAAQLWLLRSTLDPLQPLEALCILARSGDTTTIPHIKDLLLRVVSETVSAQTEWAVSSLVDIETLYF